MLALTLCAGVCGWQAAAAPVPTTLAAQPGTRYSMGRPPKKGSEVVFGSAASVERVPARDMPGLSSRDSDEVQSAASAIQEQYEHTAGGLFCEEEEECSM